MNEDNDQNDESSDIHVLKTAGRKEKRIKKSSGQRNKRRQ